MLLDMEMKALCMIQNGKKRVLEGMNKILKDEQGDTNMISIIIILVIIVALAIVFRKNIASLVNSWWEKIFADSSAATGTNASQTTFN